MAIIVQCSNCGKKMKATDELAGKRAKCPGCQQPVSIPMSGEQVPPSSKRQGNVARTTATPSSVPNSSTQVKPATAIESADAVDHGVSRNWNPRLWIMPVCLALILSLFGFGAMQGTARDPNPDTAALGVLPGLAAVALIIIGIYVMTFTQTHTLGSAIVGAVASIPLLVGAIGVGWILLTVLGPVALPIYGAIIGLVTWAALWWIRGWQAWAGMPWQGDQGAFASFLGRMNEDGTVSLKGAEGKTLVVPWSKSMEHRQIFASALGKELIGSELVTYITPDGRKFGGALQVTKKCLYVQFRLPVVGQLAQLEEGAIIQNTDTLYGLPAGAVRYARRHGEVIFVVMIPSSKGTDARSIHGWITHRVALESNDGLTHQFKYGIFPATRLLNALRDAGTKVREQEAARKQIGPSR